MTAMLNKAPTRAPKHLQLCLFLGVFALRLVVLRRLTGSHYLLPNSGDMQFYNDWALRILHGNWTEHTAFYGLPLYAYLLAAIYKIVGYGPFVPGFLQAGLEAGTSVLLYKLALVSFDHAEQEETRSASDNEPENRKVVGLIAAIGWAFFQPAQAYSVILMPTAWLVFVFWLVVWQIVRWRKPPRFWRLFLLGTLIGVTAMGIATILFLLPLVLAALLVRCRTTLLQWTMASALFVTGVFSGASPAWIHNFYVANDSVFLSAHSGINFWIGNNPTATGYPKFPPGLHAGQEAMLKDSISAAERAAGRPLKRSEVSAYWSEKGVEWISKHPLQWLALIGTKMKNFWNAYQYDDLSIVTPLQEQGVTLPGLRFGLVAALAIPGMLLACWQYRRARWIAAAVFLHMAALLTVFITERYRLAAVPGLALFASFGLWTLWQHLTEMRYREATVFIILLFCGTAFVSLPQRDETLWALDSYNSGLQALEAGQLSVARRKLDVAYAYSRQNAEVNFAQGNLKLALGEKQVAKSFYLRALLLDSRHVGAFNNLGIIALEEKQWGLAARFFRHALMQLPNDSKLHYLLARSYLEDRELAQARDEIEIALALAPDRPELQALERQIKGRHEASASVGP
jgi:tetratricopeptide (TPR) repeat protein